MSTFFQSFFKRRPAPIPKGRAFTCDSSFYRNDHDRERGRIGNLTRIDPSAPGEAVAWDLGIDGTPVRLTTSELIQGAAKQSFRSKVVEATNRVWPRLSAEAWDAELDDLLFEMRLGIEQDAADAEQAAAARDLLAVRAANHQRQRDRGGRS